jgi:hypothetical protein
VKVVGLTCGIATVGWSVLDVRTASLTIEAAGVWSWDAPETAEDRTPLNAVRRLHRGQRRVIRRRRQRMNEVRRLFCEAGLLPTADRAALGRPASNPWDLRAAAFARRLTGDAAVPWFRRLARGFRFLSRLLLKTETFGTAVDKSAAGRSRAPSRWRFFAVIHRKREGIIGKGLSLRVLGGPKTAEICD